jgi:hypothetical protein
MSSTILDLSPISRVRRNHAVEHAALHVLSSRNPARSLAGYSDLKGFWIIGNVTTEELQQAVEEGMARLRSGEYALAVHQNCGTNYATSGMVAGSLAWLVMLNPGRGLRRKLDRWPLLVTLVTIGLVIAQPLGLYIQANFTTDPDLKGLQVTGIMLFPRREVMVHRVLTRN